MITEEQYNKLMEKLNKIETMIDGIGIKTYHINKKVDTLLTK